MDAESNNQVNDSQDKSLADYIKRIEKRNKEEYLVFPEDSSDRPQNPYSQH